MELQNRIGLRVRALRRAKNLTQEELAERSGKSVDTLSLVERGRILPALDTLYGLAVGLGEPIAQLLPDGPDDPELPAPLLKLRELAWAALCQLDDKALAVAVAQLDALRTLKH